MNISRAFVFVLITLAYTANAVVTVAWDNATPLANQTITGTEIFVNGSSVGATDEQTYAIDDSGWLPGVYAITARHIGTVDGIAAVSAQTSPVVYTMADSGVPGVAPELRFHGLGRGAS